MFLVYVTQNSLSQSTEHAEADVRIQLSYNELDIKEICKNAKQCHRCQYFVLEQSYFFLKICMLRGIWVAQSVKHPTLAQVMISQFVSSSPVWGTVC